MAQNQYNRGTAWVAQLVEHSPEEGRVGSSSLPPSTDTQNARNCGLLFICAWGERHLCVFCAGSNLSSIPPPLLTQRNSQIVSTLESLLYSH